MVSLIRERWNPNQQTAGASIVRFTITRDGTITSVDVDRSSGYMALDQSARRAILLTGQLPPLPTAFTGNSLTVRLTFRVSTMSQPFQFFALTSVVVTAALLSAQQPEPTTEPARQRSEVELIIGDRIGAQPRIAVPDCLALSDDPETATAARTIAEVLWNDLDFEREFRMIARDTYDSIPPARSVTDLPMAEWQLLGRRRNRQLQRRTNVTRSNPRHRALI